MPGQPEVRLMCMLERRIAALFLARLGDAQVYFTIKRAELQGVPLRVDAGARIRLQLCLFYYENSASRQETLNSPHQSKGQNWVTASYAGTGNVFSFGKSVRVPSGHIDQVHPL